VFGEKGRGQEVEEAKEIKDAKEKRVPSGE
jgi:hypothetical protein